MKKTYPINMCEHMNKIIVGASAGVGILTAVMAFKAGRAYFVSGGGGGDQVRKVRKSHVSSDPITNYILKHSLRQHPVQEKLMQVTMEHRYGRMLSAPDQMQFLANMCKCIGAKKTIDVGVFTGYSALSIALVLPSDGVVVACDISEEFTDIGKPFWKEAGVDKNIDLRIAPAAETLQYLIDMGEVGTYDFAFIDADKSGYDTYYELCLQLMRPGAIIAFDNVLWGGSVADPTNNKPDTLALKTLNTKLMSDTRINITMLPIGDGVTLAFKL